MYYRDKSNNEIDMIIESDGQLHPLEIKRSINPSNDLIKTFTILDKGSVPKGKGAIICMRPELSAINSDNLIVPIWMIWYLVHNIFSLFDDNNKVIKQKLKGLSPVEFRTQSCKIA